MKISSKNIFQKILFLILGIILGLVSFYLYSRSQTQTNTFTETRKQSNFKFISPLIECDPLISSNNNLDDLKKNVESIIDQNIQQKNIEIASVYYRDLNNGPWIGINEKENFIPASLIKIPIMVTFFKEAESNPTILQQKLKYETDLNLIEKQNFIPEQSIQKDQEYTIEELIEKMIIYSDNHSYELLLSHINQNDFFQTFHDLGINIDNLIKNNNESFLTVKDYASFFRTLYNASYLNENFSEKALSLLSQTTFKEGIVKNLPQNITVSHKYGERSFNDNIQKQLHDCGIIYLPQKPYLLCVMTKGTNFNQLTKTIQQISKSVYENLLKNNSN